jgi:hypothetical protein
MIHHAWLLFVPSILFGAALFLAIPSSQTLNPFRPGTLLINAGFISDHQADVRILFGIRKNY